MIYDSAKRKHPAIEELLALFRYRDFISQLIRRDIVARYKRSILGIAWTMLNPLGTMLIMVVVFSRVFDRVQSYPAYVLTGLICWTMFSQSTSHSISMMVWGSRLVQQIYLPKTAFIVSTVIASMVNFLLSLIPLFIILAITKTQLTWSVVLLPISMILILLFSLGVSFLISTLAVFFPDVEQIYPVLLLAWMYMSPIIVPKEILQNALNGWLLKLNPFYYVLNIFRIIMYHGSTPTAQDWGLALAVSLSVFLLGWFVFTKKSDAIAYYV
jgi:ABC-type polysaccharide/polyol phosphate export permease